MKQKTLAFLRNPWVLIAAMVLGVLISQYCKPLLPAMDFIANVYLRLLQMCVIPIVVCAVTVNVGNLLRGGNKSLLFKWLALCAAILVLFSAAAVGGAALFADALRPDAQTQALLADLSGGAKDTEVTALITPVRYGGDHIPAEKEGFSPAAFVYSLIPQNIFSALSAGEMLPTLLFFLLLGCVLSTLKAEQSGPVFRAFEGLYAAMNRVVEWILIPFPIAIMAMLAQQFSGEGVFSLIGSLVPLVGIELGVMAALCLMTFGVVQLSRRCTVKDHLNAVRRTFFIAMGTSSCMATVSVALEDMCEHLHIKRQVAHAIMPISLSMCQPGVAASVAIAAIYGMLIYGVPFSAAAFASVIIFSIIFSLAVIGVPGLVAVSMLTIVLEPLFIPSQLIITLYLAIIPIINPPTVFTSVYANFGIVSLLDCEKEKKHEKRH